MFLSIIYLSKSWIFYLLLMKYLLMKDPFGLLIIKYIDEDLTDIRGKEHEVNHYKKSKALQ